MDSDDDVIVANTLIILIARTINMLNRQLEAQGEKFKKDGGFREQLKAARTEEVAKQENAPACPECGSLMRKRLAKSGKNAGKAFWGCPAYPKCNGARQI